MKCMGVNENEEVHAKCQMLQSHVQQLVKTNHLRCQETSRGPLLASNLGYAGEERRANGKECTKLHKKHGTGTADAERNNAQCCTLTHNKVLASTILHNS